KAIKRVEVLRNKISHFFFQAEDGIRDFHVTGVQTCALPISPSSGNVLLRFLRRKGFSEKLLEEAGLVSSSESDPPRFFDRFRGQIGRASCRERGQTAGGRARGTRAIAGRTRPGRTTTRQA